MFNEKVWKDGERETAIYLKKLGYKILYTNFKCVGVELDIVALESKRHKSKKLKQVYKSKLKELTNKIEIKTLKSNLKAELTDLKPTLIVVEVKSRSSEKFGKGYEAIDKKKKEHVSRGLKFLLSQDKFSGFDSRIDISSVDDGKITYFENAI